MKKIKSYFIISISVSALSFPIQGFAFQTNKSEVKPDAYGQTFSLTISEGAVSAKIENVSVGEVLKRFSDVAEVDITVSKARAKEIISVDFSNLPLQKGIQRILGENYTLIYDSLGSQKLTDIRIVNNFSMSNTVAGKSWIRFSPDINFATTKQNRDELKKLVFLGKLPNDSGNIDSEVLINLALNDANTQVRKLAFLALAKQAGTKIAKIVLQKSLENYSTQEVQTFAQSLLKQLDETTDDKLVTASAVNQALPFYSSLSSNVSTQSNSSPSENQSAAPENSDVTTSNLDSKEVSAPETVIEKNDNDLPQVNDSVKDNPEKNEIKPESELKQNDEENASEENKENEIQQENENDEDKVEKPEPQKTFKQKLDEADPQDILPILTEGIRQGLEVDVATLDQFASGNYPVELRQTAIEEIIDQLGYQDGYEYLKQKIAAEPEPEMAEFIKAVGVQFINDAKWITKKTFDRSPFQ